ncbi:MAG: ACT domain-containing protein [Lachnospiraceae bacterium]|nr:ACT domain-containing protein [Lachnospiraceae bacterium]
MELEKLSYDLTVCKVADIKDVDLSSEFFFLEKTDEEISLVCRTEDVPGHTIEREDGWKAFRIKGVLDFSLVGILSKITEILAENKIGIFAVSTYNTDYILVRSGEFKKAMTVLAAGGYSIA